MTLDHNRFPQRGAPRWHRTSAITLALVAALAVSCRGQKPSDDQTYVPVPVNPPPVPRTVRPLPAEAFAVEWIGHDVPPILTVGETRNVAVTFRNISLAPWPDPDSTSQEPIQAGAVRLAYRWWAADGKPLAWGRRADLERVLQPGQAVTLKLTVTAPPAPGGYRLQLDLVQEMVAYFEDRSAARLFVPVEIR